MCEELWSGCESNWPKSKLADVDLAKVELQGCGDCGPREFGGRLCCASGARDAGATAVDGFGEGPHVRTEDDALPPDTECALILCTNGCFHSAHFAEQVLAAAARGVHFIPVVAEENFHFPTKALYKEVRRRVSSCSAEDLVTAIDTIFEEIAINVVLQGAEEIIAVHVAAIAGRLQETRSSRPLEHVDQNAGSATVHSSESSAAPDRSRDLSKSDASLVELDEHSEEGPRSTHRTPFFESSSSQSRSLEGLPLPHESEIWV